MGPISTTLIVIIVVLLAIYLLRSLFIGASVLLAWAGMQGFVGVAAYVTCWIFLAPFMAVASIVIGMMPLDSQEPPDGEKE